MLCTTFKKHSQSRVHPLALAFSLLKILEREKFPAQALIKYSSRKVTVGTWNSLSWKSSDHSLPLQPHFRSFLATSFPFRASATEPRSQCHPRAALVPLAACPWTHRTSGPCLLPESRKFPCSAARELREKLLENTLKSQDTGVPCVERKSGLNIKLKKGLTRKLWQLGFNWKTRI